MIAAADALFGSFKADPNAPMEVEANMLDIIDASKKAVFTGNVMAHQGDLMIRTVELTAFYSGGAAFGTATRLATPGARGAGQRIETRQKVVITSKDDRTAIAEWANFDVKANTALLGGGVTVVRGKDIAEGPRLKIDLTTGQYRFEGDSEAGAGDRKNVEPLPDRDGTLGAHPRRQDQRPHVPARKAMHAVLSERRERQGQGTAEEEHSGTGSALKPNGEETAVPNASHVTSRNAPSP